MTATDAVGILHAVDTAVDVITVKSKGGKSSNVNEIIDILDLFSKLLIREVVAGADEKKFEGNNFKLTASSYHFADLGTVEPQTYLDDTSDTDKLISVNIDNLNNEDIVTIITKIIKCISK